MSGAASVPRDRAVVLAGVVATVVLAVGLRTAAWLEVRDSPIPHLHLWTESDPSFFDRWARSIAAGDLLTRNGTRPLHSWHETLAREAHRLSGDPEPYSPVVRERIWDAWLGPRSFYQDPLYPYFLAAVYSLPGGGPRLVHVVQALLGALSALLVLELGRSCFGPWTGALAGCLAALYGPLVFQEVMLQRAVLATALGLALVLAVGRSLASPGLGWPFLAGALGGLAQLLRANFLLYTASAALLLALLPRGAPGRGRARTLAAFGAGFVLVLLPLLGRHLAVGAEPSIAASAGVVTFVNQNAGDFVAGRGGAYSTHAAEIMVRSDGRLLPAVAETVRSHGGVARFTGLLLRKALVFWSWYEIPNNGSYDYYLRFAETVRRFGLRFSLVAPLALVGMVAAWPLRRRCAPLYAYLLCGYASCVLFLVLSRLRLPFAVAAIPFAAFALVRTVELVRERRWRTAGAMALGAILLALLVLRPWAAPRERVRLADYGVGNEIALHLARTKVEDGELRPAALLLERQLKATEPADLRRIEPPVPGRLSRLSAEVAGSFAPLHAELAALEARLGNSAAAAHHERRAAVLAAVERQWAGAAAQGPDRGETP